MGVILVVILGLILFEFANGFDEILRGKWV